MTNSDYKRRNGETWHPTKGPENLRAKAFFPEHRFENLTRKQRLCHKTYIEAQHCSILRHGKIETCTFDAQRWVIGTSSMPGEELNSCSTCNASVKHTSTSWHRLLLQPHYFIFRPRSHLPGVNKLATEQHVMIEKEWPWRQSFNCVLWVWSDRVLSCLALSVCFYLQTVLVR